MRVLKRLTRRKNFPLKVLRETPFSVVSAEGEPTSSLKMLRR